MTTGARRSTVLISKAAMAVFIGLFMDGTRGASADEPQVLTQAARYVPCGQETAGATGERPTDDQTTPRDLCPINRDTMPVVRTAPVLVAPDLDLVTQARRIMKKGVAPELLEFLRQLHGKIVEARAYPPNAIKLGLQGTATVNLHLMPGGQARAMRIRKSSGHGMLDEAAVETVQNILPLKPPPEAGNHPLELDIPISFTLR